MEQHPDTLDAMSNLALFLSEQKNRLGEAESLHRRVCARWSKSRGPEHPGTLSSVTQLAQFLVYIFFFVSRILTIKKINAAWFPNYIQDVKRSKASSECADEALQLYNRAYQGRKAKLGPDHPSTHFSLFLLNRFKAKRAKRAGGARSQTNISIPQISSISPGTGIGSLSCF